MESSYVPSPKLAELINDKSVWLNKQSRHFPLHPAGRLSGSQGDGELRLADTDAAEQNHIAMFRQEAHAKQMRHLRPVDLLRPVPVRGIACLDRYLAGVPP